MQAFNQNVLIEDNVDLLKNFINSFENIDQINSQLYQDVFASFIIGEKFEKTYLEFGATDGFNLSNSYLLENSFNWTGVLSEPSPQWHEALKKNRKNSDIITKCIWKEPGKRLDFFELHLRLFDVPLLPSYSKNLGKEAGPLGGSELLPRALWVRMLVVDAEDDCSSPRRGAR